MQGKKLLAAFMMTGLILPEATWAAEPLPTMGKYLQELKLDPSVLDGLDKELAVPPAWVEGAKKEGTVKVLAGYEEQEFKAIAVPFMERYPGIKVTYESASNFFGRAQKPLLAFKEGRYITDVLVGFGGAATNYREANALEDLRVLPNWDKPDPATQPEDGIFAAPRLDYWCLAYNTKKVQQSDLPKTWDDLLDNPRWRNGALGIIDRPQLWIIMLQEKYGEDYVKNYIDKLFTVVKPQLRKEGASALIGLVALGEVDGAVPTRGAAVKVLEDKGAPVTWHCPSPVATDASQIGILKGSPHVNSAKLFVNWVLSKEGQIALNRADGSVPSHRGLQREELIPYAKEILGKPTMVDNDEKLEALNKIWNAAWTKAGGKK